jgi:hypothetical protein
MLSLGLLALLLLVYFSRHFSAAKITFTFRPVASGVRARKKSHDEPNRFSIYSLGMPNLSGWLWRGANKNFSATSNGCLSGLEAF